VQGSFTPALVLLLVAAVSLSGLPAHARAAVLSTQVDGPLATPFSVTVSEPAPTSLVPVADASVLATDPLRNFGDETTLVSDGDPVKVAYVNST
jgi:hypothetical protein